MIRLPDVPLETERSIESTLQGRRSVRDYAREPLPLREVAQLLWAAQGVTGKKGERTAPSAGALYPLEVYLVAGAVEGLREGVYRYRPPRHDLLEVAPGDRRRELSAASLGQEVVRDGAASIVIAAVYERITKEYGETRGLRYVYMEVGHAAQNVLLEAVALDLGAVVVGAFDDRKIRKIVGLRDHERPMLVVPFGRMR